MTTEKKLVIHHPDSGWNCKECEYGIQNLTSAWLSERKRGARWMRRHKNEVERLAELDQEDA